MPPWYYGMAYRDWQTQSAVFYPIPLNYFLSFLRGAEIRWNRMRGRACWFDVELGRQYANGFTEGKKYAERHLRDEVREKEREKIEAETIHKLHILAARNEKPVGEK